MAVNDLITFRKGIASQWISANPVLASGEPGYDLTNSILKIGDGVSNWTSLSGIGSTSVGGSSSSVGVRGIINTTGNLTSFAISGGYPVGYLDLFQDGIKLVSDLDFSATDGSNVTLSNSVPSGTTLEYLTISSGVSVGGTSSGFSWSAIPGSPTSSGVAGDIAYDSEYFYVATNNNVWKRAALSTWVVPSPTPTITSSPTNTPIILTITPTPTATVTPTPSSVFDTTLVIASGSNSASANGVTLTGASGSSMRFNQTSPINNPLSFTDIRIYLSGVYTYRITTYTEVITGNKTFVLVSNTGTSYISSFGAGTDFGSYRRINL